MVHVPFFCYAYAMKERSMKERFRKTSAEIALWTGSPAVFAGSVILTLVWLLTGPMFHYSDTWQLVINTGTTVITFLMVFLIQNSQNRDSKAVQLKLDELIRSTKGARMRYMGLEDLSDEELSDVEEEIRAITLSPSAKHALVKLHARITDEKDRRVEEKKHRFVSLHVPHP